MPVRFILILISAAWLVPAADPAKAQERPDIVVIMLDDMGFSDLGCYGGEIRTPHIDRLADGGLRFMQFYNAARCCPTRAALLTGLYPHQVNLARNGRSLGRNGVTIAEVLREAGYRTGMTGKWHLSFTPVLKGGRHLDWINHHFEPGRPFGPLDTYPVKRGFEKHYGIIWSVVNYFDPFSLVEGTEPVPQVPDDYYITDAITEKSIEYIREFARDEAPFFLYVAHCAPHWPLHARAEDIARYRDTYKKGWHKLRRDRYQRQMKMGLFEPQTAPLPELQGYGRDWDELSGDDREFESACMAVHAAMIDRVDQGVGRIVETLKAAGRFENTVIIVLSDNGASPERARRPGYDRPSQTRDGRRIRYTGRYDPGGETTWACIGSRWASAANTPFRYWKKESFEGGCHTPLIVHWPRGLKTKPGSTDRQPGHVIDLMPTCLDLAGAEYPSEFLGRTITPLEGKSLLPILRGRQRRGHGSLFFEHEGGRAVRRGDWKLVALKNEPWELYNLKTDQTETRNLAEKHPDRVKQMAAKWQKWAKRVGVPQQ